MSFRCPVSGAASGVTSTLSVPESRPSIYSNGTKQRLDSPRSREGIIPLKEFREVKAKFAVAAVSGVFVQIDL